MSMTPAASHYFDQNAENWDQLRVGYFDETVRAAAIQKAYLRPEMIVADVGAGTGFLSAGLAPLVARVILLDGSAEMLAVAKRNLAAYSNLEFHPADGLALPLPDESVDAAFANMYLHHCPDPLAALREMARILKPGGRLILTDLDAHPFAWLKEEMADVWQGFEREQILAWLREAGLVNRIADCTGTSCCAETAAPLEHAENRRSASISVFVAAGTKRVAAHSVVQEHYTAAVQQGCGCGGEQPQGAACCQDSSAANTEASCCQKNPASTAESSCCQQTSAPAAESSCCQSGGASCCSPAANADPFDPGYTADQRAAAPADAVEVAFGCGNPTALAGLRRAEKVLDIGSGGGIDAFLAAKKVGPLGRVIGVDMTPAMLERARATAKRSGYYNVEFRQGQAETLPVEDNTVDVVISNCVINLTEDKGQVFAEAYRVLKPGGRLEVSDMLAGGSLPQAAVQDAAGWSACIGGSLPEGEYTDLIRQAGFTAITVRRSPAEIQVGGVPVYSAQVSASKS